MSSTPKTPATTVTTAVLMPALFVFLWSTGFIGGKLGLPHAEPMTFLAIRFAIVAAGLTLVALVFRASWPRDWRQIAHLAVVGILLHGLYLGGVFAAIHDGVEAGTSALVVGIQPILTAILAGPVLGERVTRRQWLGFLLGLSGVALVVEQKLGLGLGTPFGMGLCVVALFGITLGTLYQKRFCTAMDLRSGNAIQFTAAFLMTTAMAFIFETRVVNWTPEFMIALAWLVIVLSFGAITLLMVLIRQGAASRVASLFFLVPPCTAVFAYFLFGEVLGPLEIGGMAITAVGVLLVNRPDIVARRGGG